MRINTEPALYFRHNHYNRVIQELDRQDKVTQEKVVSQLSELSVFWLHYDVELIAITRKQTKKKKNIMIICAGSSAILI